MKQGGALSDGSALRDPSGRPDQDHPARARDRARAYVQRAALHPADADLLLDILGLAGAM